MNKIKPFFILFFVVQLFSYGQNKKYDIRNANWGMTKDEVKNSESFNLNYDSDWIYTGAFSNYLKDGSVEVLYAYRATSLGDFTPNFIRYFFVLDGLVEFEYVFPSEEYFLKEGGSRSEYERLEEYYINLLNKKYGNSTDDYYDNNKLNRSITWETNRSIIKFSIPSGSFPYITLYSKKFKKELEEVIKMQRQRLKNPIDDL